MAVFLTVLKIIGLVLLYILAVLLFLLFLVLVVPIRYKVKGHYEDDAFLDARVSYLLHIFSVRFLYNDALNMTIRLFGIPLRLKNKSNSEKNNQKNETDDETLDIDNEKSDSDLEKKKETSKDKLLNYLNVLTEDNTKAVWLTCKKRLGRMIKGILPRKIRLDIIYGLNNPYYTSIGLAIYDVLFIYLDKVVNIYPVYDEQSIKVKGSCKGRIFPIIMVVNLLAVIMDKNCRRFYKQITAKPTQKNVE